MAPRAILRLRTRLLDPALWRDLAYVLLLFPVGIVQLVVVLVVFSIPYEAITYPLWFDPPGDGGDPQTVIPVGGSFGVSGSDASGEISESYVQIGPRVTHAPAEILLTVLLGLALAVLGFFLVRFSARAHAALAVALLGSDPLTLPRLRSPTTRAAVVAVSVVAAVAVAVLYLRGYVPVDLAATVWREVYSP